MLLSSGSEPLRRYEYQDLEDEEDLPENQEEEIVSPYSICNLTNVKLLIQRLPGPNEGYQVRKLAKIYEIEPDQCVDYAVDYELQVKQQMSMYSSHKFSGQHGEFIKVLFNHSVLSPEEAHTMSIPIDSVNLN